MQVFWSGLWRGWTHPMTVFFYLMLRRHDAQHVLSWTVLSRHIRGYDPYGAMTHLVLWHTWSYDTPGAMTQLVLWYTWCYDTFGAMTIEIRQKEVRGSEECFNVNVHTNEKIYYSSFSGFITDTFTSTKCKWKPAVTRGIFYEKQTEYCNITNKVCQWSRPSVVALSFFLNQLEEILLLIL